MKKVLSAILAVIIAVTAFAMTAFADATKTDAIINEILETRSISITFDNESLEKYAIPLLIRLDPRDITLSKCPSVFLLYNQNRKDYHLFLSIIHYK